MKTTAICILAGVLALGLVLVWSGAGVAYDTYTGTYCAVCHPGFHNKGALHDLHVTALTNNCNLCHPSGAGSKPVSTHSAGDATAYSCAGCHGRDYGGTVGVKAAGLRRHHANLNPPVTRCADCHTSDPVDLAFENVFPPHYGRSDVKLTSSCNDNLDNDGDMLYDNSDPDCSVPVDKSTWGSVKALYKN